MYTLKSKVVVITGGANGIGFAIADVFLKNEAKSVVILYINENHGNAAIENLNAKYGKDKAIFFEYDVPHDCESILNNIIQKYEVIDIFVNSAGVCDEFNVTRCININVIAVINLTFKIYEYMRKDKGGQGGTIINISSTFGLVNSSHMPVYGASKHAVVGFSQSIGHEDRNKRTDVRVIAVCPGKTGTKFTDVMVDRDEEMQKKWLDIVDDFPSQTHEELATAVVDVYEKANSGTTWRIVGGVPVQNYPNEINIMTL